MSSQQPKQLILHSFYLSLNLTELTKKNPQNKPKC